MITFAIDGGSRRPLNVLCIGSHSDDIEIGCGGTILRLAETNPGSTFHWFVMSANGVRGSEAMRAAELFAGAAHLKGPVLKNFRDGFLPYVGADVKAIFEEMKPIKPDLILTHTRNDAHQDHRLVCELTWNTFRNHAILEYEIPKYDGDLGQPSVFVPLSKELCDRKVQYLHDAFESQRAKHWFQPETFLSLMRLRGMECGSPSGYAEAFYCRKLLI